MRKSTRSAIAAAVLVAAMSAPAQAGDFFWWRAHTPPPPVHVYDFSRGPTWTSNGWSYPPVEVQYPSPVPYPGYPSPGCGVAGHHGCLPPPPPLK
jgi:hypothetical protein